MRILVFIILLIQCNWCIAQRSDTTYYSNGQLFSYTYGSRDGLVYLHFKLSPLGDTLNLEEHDFSGNLEDFRSRSYCKNLKSEITLSNGNGIFNYYKSKGDSIYMEGDHERYGSSMFFPLKRLFDIESQVLLDLDTLFIDAFKTRKNYSKEEFVDRLQLSTKKLHITDSLDLEPYINIASNMLYMSWANRQNVKDIRTPKDQMPYYFKLLNREVRNSEEISKVHEYFRYQSNLTKGEWLYYSGLVRFLHSKVSEHCLFNAYKYAMSWIVYVSKENIKTNNKFESSYLKLHAIVDTLGNSFQQIKVSVVGDFKRTLTDNEREIIQKVSKLYDEVLLEYYSGFLEDNKNRNGGVDINRVKYYDLITEWQLKIANRRLFNQKNRSKLPPEFEGILEKFDIYLGMEHYTVLEQAELGMFNALEGMNSYTVTPYNPYFMARDKKKRKFRRFNWLVK
jgi:hypothetical protein